LIVEDNADVRESLEMALRLEGFDVRSAGNGAEGLVEMRREPAPCAVLLDLHMPQMSGFEFRAEQVKHPDLLAIPVLLFSGHHDVADAAAEMGIAAYFQKPFDIDQIVDLLRRYADEAPVS
jgi:DNA-binding NtrC family response regulator